jgi:hypothetical protein
MHPTLGGQELKDDRGMIRVSCSALSLIEIDKLILLEVNKNRGNVLTPLGGALEFCEEARPFLADLKATFEKRYDLRMVLPVENLARFEVWFRRRIERETDPVRELKEELIQEHAALEQWPEAGVAINYLGIVIDRGITTRRGLEGVPTTYFFEMFQVDFHKSITETIVRAVSCPGSQIRLVTREDINKRFDSHDGMPIASTAQLLFAV